MVESKGRVFKCNYKTVTYACVHTACFINVHINCIHKLPSLSVFFTYLERAGVFLMYESLLYTVSSQKKRKEKKKEKVMKFCHSSALD